VVNFFTYLLPKQKQLTTFIEFDNFIKPIK